MQSNGTWGSWASLASDLISAADAGLFVNSTGASNLVIGGAYDDGGTAIPFGAPGLGGAPGLPGNIRDVYLFGTAFRSQGIRTGQGFVAIEQASFTDLQKAGMVGYWKAAYDPNGLVYNQVDGSYAAPSSGTQSVLAPLSGREVEGITLYVNGTAVTTTLLTTTAPSPSGTNYLNFDAGNTYRIQEISFWSMARQAYQVLSDMFGQLIPSNEPFLTLYMPGSFSVDAPGVDEPILPMAKYIENVDVENMAAAFTIDLGSASLDLQGCPAIGSCGPLVSPNLYTPPGIALTICDTPPSLTTYSVTVNSVTGTLAGVLDEVYVFVRNNVLTVYAGKKVGDLALVWVSQEQGDVQIIGYIEGAPPAPMANLTNKASYAGATSVSFNAPISLSYKYQTSDDGVTTNKGSGGASVDGRFESKQPSSPTTISVNQVDAISGGSGGATVVTVNQGENTTTLTQSDSGSTTVTNGSAPAAGGANMRFRFGIGPVLAAMGFGIKAEKLTVDIDLSAGVTASYGSGSGSTTQQTASEKLG